jgi:hypothetical protein
MALSINKITAFPKSESSYVERFAALAQGRSTISDKFRVEELDFTLRASVAMLAGGTNPDTVIKYIVEKHADLFVDR